jgi:hypothetical protein
MKEFMTEQGIKYQVVCRMVSSSWAVAPVELSCAVTLGDDTLVVVAIGVG